MPRKGYRTITIQEQIYKKLEKEADKQHRTVPNFIEVLIAKPVVVEPAKKEAP